MAVGSRTVLAAEQSAVGGREASYRTRLIGRLPLFFSPAVALAQQAPFPACSVQAGL